MAPTDRTDPDLGPGLDLGPCPDLQIQAAVAKG